MEGQTGGLRKCRVEELDDSYRVVFMPQGLGDILFFLMYASEYKRRIPEKHIAVVVIKKHFMQLAEMFAERIDALCFMDMEEEPYWRNRMTYFYEGIYCSAPQPYLLYAVRNAMGLDASARAYLPDLPRTPGLETQEMEWGLKKGRAILIAPDAVSCNVNVSDALWMEIASICEQAGFQVFFNTSDLSRFEDYPKIFLSMAETMRFIEDAGGFLSFRSGLCDVMAAFTNVHSLIIYPNPDKPEKFFAFSPRFKYNKEKHWRMRSWCSQKNTLTGFMARSLVMIE